MKIKRIEHVAIAVDDMSSSMGLLADVFGLDLEYEEQIGSTRLAMYPVGQTYIELLEAVGEDSAVAGWIREKGQGLFHLCFEVDDIDGALAELKEKGVKLLVGASFGGPRQQSLHGLDHRRGKDLPRVEGPVSERRHVDLEERMKTDRLEQHPEDVSPVGRRVEVGCGLEAVDPAMAEARILFRHGRLAHPVRPAEIEQDGDQTGG